MNTETTTAASSITAISIDQLTVSYPGCLALDHVNLTIPSGTVYALLGENGAGKTTLIRALTGFLKPSSGRCQVLGLDPATDALSIRQRIGYVSDAPALYDWMTVGEIGWFAASFYATGYLERYLELIAGYEVPEYRKIKALSKGQRAKVALALALAHDPQLLILDEPTSGLDPLVRREFLESMLDRVATGRTVLLSSHQIAEVERVADYIAIIHQGSFRVADTLQRLRETVHELTITVEDPLVSLPLLAEPVEVLSDQAEGRQRQLIVQGMDNELLETLRNSNGIKQVTSRSATLDELFAACVRGQGQREVAKVLNRRNRNSSEVA
ncbi:MAG TPA: ABC transporter ATP-binding protein [Planctomycetaceae bacterium]|nr:ABC transporter ATP-binding protein [Planctomycetaceae bacterium]